MQTRSPLVPPLTQFFPKESIDSLQKKLSTPYQLIPYNECRFLLLFTTYLIYNTYISGDSETELVDSVLLLTSDFILDVDTLDQKDPDEQMSEFFSWWTEINEKKNDKVTRSSLFFADYAYKYCEKKNMTIGGK